MPAWNHERVEHICVLSVIAVMQHLQEILATVSSHVHNQRTCLIGQIVTVLGVVSIKTILFDTDSTRAGN